MLHPNQKFIKPNLELNKFISFISRTIGNNCVDVQSVFVTLEIWQWYVLEVVQNLRWKPPRIINRECINNLDEGGDLDKQNILCVPCVPCGPTKIYIPIVIEALDAEDCYLIVLYFYFSLIEAIFHPLIFNFIPFSNVASQILVNQTPVINVI